jgi:mannosyl-oligosaccharide alpha-1,2-mannosidase
LEWTKLSDLTKDPKYGKLAQRAEEVLLEPQPKSAELFPGLIGTEIDIVTGNFQLGTASWGGGADSFYEYLLKMYLYDTHAFLKYKDRWVQAADSTMKHLASRPEGHHNITFLGQYDGKAGVLLPESGHMACFAGGNFLLGGLALDDSSYTTFGLVSESNCTLYQLLTCTGTGKWLSSHLCLHQDTDRSRRVQMDTIRVQ